MPQVGPPSVPVPGTRTSITTDASDACSIIGQVIPASGIFSSTTPRCVCLTGISTDVEIDEAIIRRTLCEGAEKIRPSVFPFLDANWEFESQILIRESLLLNGFVIAAVTFLNAEIKVAWRPLDDYAKNYLSFHGMSITPVATMPVTQMS